MTCRHIQGAVPTQAVRLQILEPRSPRTAGKPFPAAHRVLPHRARPYLGRALHKAIQCILFWHRFCSATVFKRRCLQYDQAYGSKFKALSRSEVVGCCIFFYMLLSWILLLLSYWQPSPSPSWDLYRTAQGTSPTASVKRSKLSVLLTVRKKQGKQSLKSSYWDLRKDTKCSENKIKQNTGGYQWGWSGYLLPDDFEPVGFPNPCSI